MMQLLFVKIKKQQDLPNLVINNKILETLGSDLVMH